MLELFYTYFEINLAPVISQDLYYNLYNGQNFFLDEHQSQLLNCGKNTTMPMHKFSNHQTPNQRICRKTTQ